MKFPGQDWDQIPVEILSQIRSGIGPGPGPIPSRIWTRSGPPSQPQMSPWDSNAQINQPAEHFSMRKKLKGGGGAPLGLTPKASAASPFRGRRLRPSAPMGSPSPKTFPKREMRGGRRRAAAGARFSKVVDLAPGFRSVATRPPEDL